MKRIFWLGACLLPLQLLAQDSTMSNLTKEMDASDNEKKIPAKIFISDKVINANTTEPIGRGKMDFKVTHNFDDIVANTVYGPPGAHGGIKNFYGLDVTTDVRIGFALGLTDRLDLILARAKGSSYLDAVKVTNLFEVGFKYQLLRQLEDDPHHPLAMSFFFSNVISTMDTTRSPTMKFKNTGDRMSQTFQLIIAKKIGRVSIQLNPTLVTQGYVQRYDLQKTMFALGGAIRVPVTRHVNILVDYFHPFRTTANEASFKDPAHFSRPVKFSDPLGIGFEIITPGHVFHLNFTNCADILESRFIPYTVTSWGDGQFRWGFTISRTFGLWKPKSK